MSDESRQELDLEVLAVCSDKRKDCLERSDENRQELDLEVVECQCEELKSIQAELKLDLADRNARITALELQFEADNYPIKKKAADLEKSLEQAKHKINELKTEVRRYQGQMHEVTVGLRSECERCRSAAPVHDLSVTSPAHAEILAHKDKEIAFLKTLCKSFKKKIDDLEQSSGSKMPRPHRSALKEKENSHPPS